MKQERMKILSLLEDGIITAEDATKLLETLKSSDDRVLFNEETAEHLGEGFSRFAKNVDHWAREFGHKVECAYREVEPKLKQVSCNVLEKTACMMDDISKSIHDSVENAKARAEEEAKQAAEVSDDDAQKPN